MNEQSRIFDFLYYQLSNFSKEIMFAAKIGDEWKGYSTQEVADTINKLSAGFLKMGLSGKDMQVENQDKIAIVSKNRPEWLMLDMACQQVGICLCPIYPTTNPKELAFILNDATIKYIFISGEDILEKVESVKEEVPSLKGIYTFDKLPGVTCWDEVFKNITTEDLQKVETIKATIKATHCATIIYTSGTTGKPKGVMLSHRNLVSNVLNSVASFPFEEKVNGRSLSFLPLNHIFERMVSYIYIYNGISIYYAQSLDTIGEDLKEVKPNLFTTVPRLLEKVYEKIMNKGKELTGIKRKLFDWAVGLGSKYDNLKNQGFLYNAQLAIANKLIFNKWREALGGEVEFIITGGAACQVRLIRIFTAAGINIYEGYGPTENSPVISVNCKYEGGTKFGTVGPVINGQEVRLAADGEICVKGPSVMMGYYKRPDLTAETIVDGWLLTGDIGVFEDNKFLKITDRKKELFKTSGGKYVAPQPIENKMKESSFIEQMMVVGEGEKFVSALIVPAMHNLKEWCKTKNINVGTHTEIIAHPEVIKLFKRIIEKFNQEFNNVEQVKKFELLPEEWTIETGELTPTLKLKRRIILEKYRSVLEKLYH